MTSPCLPIFHTFALLGLVFLAGCQPETPRMTPEETNRIDALTERMAPRCIGRYMIDLPKEFVLNPIATTRLDGVDIVVEPMKQYQFDELLRQRHEQLRSERILGQGTPSLAAAMPLSDGSGYVFDRSRTQNSPVLRTLELLAFRDGFRIEILVNTRDLRYSENKHENDTRRTDVQEKLDHLLKIYSRIRGRADDEIPTEPGVCFANGFLQGDSSGAEQVDLYYHLHSVDDVYFTFHTLSDLVEDASLLERGPAIEAWLKKRNGRTLRHGRRESHGLSFEEWLMTLASESNPELMFSDMTLEVNGKSASVSTPLLVVDLDSGVRHPRSRPTLEEAAIEKPLTRVTFGAAATMALWDKTTQTLRMRPVSGVPRTLPEVGVRRESLVVDSGKK